ncbi:MAG: hypothetical protein WCP79_14860 [Bacillota bacterium]
MIEFPAPIARPDNLTDVEFFEFVFEKYFKPEFIDKPVYFNGKQLEIMPTPLRHGYNRCFWHMATKELSEGTHEDDRIIDSNRCSKISWAKPTLDSVRDCLVWTKPVHSNLRICLWANHLDEDNYLVILEHRKLLSEAEQLLLWTGFPVVYKSYRKYLLKQYSRYTPV